MKRILVIDESEVVRETLALILGREFAVSKRALGVEGFSFSDAPAEVDLLILGISPQLATEAANLVRFARRLPFAVLLLVESKSLARAIQPESQVDCLIKPFNPYDLHEKVGRLLTRRPAVSKPSTGRRDLRDIACYLEYPYLSRSVATLVNRYASVGLPLLISGEIGCGQERVASGVCQLQTRPAFQISINAAEVNAEYLAQKELQLSLQGSFGGSATLVIHELDKSSASAQAALLGFLQEVENKAVGVRYVATTTSDLLERVYRGDFVEALYDKLAMLTLKLSPLRERQDDIPALANWFARFYAEVLGLGDPMISTAAIHRLRNYLWFGNLGELERVIARTLALHRKAMIDAGDLLFDFGEASPPAGETLSFSEFPSGLSTQTLPFEPPRFRPYENVSSAGHPANGHSRSVDVNVLIHELAHEFKNPMVTIKTFAQLLGDRYQDENFRTRFQEVVGADIERMDELLEVMIEFADFSPPEPNEVSLDDKLRAVLTELHGECAKRQTQFDWHGNGAGHLIRADEAHVRYILKNVLLATLGQTRIGSDIRIDLASQGALTISHVREEARMASIGHYLDDASSRPTESILPLRVLLARHLLEKNGGRFNIEPSNGDRETLRMEFPIAEHGQKN